jgi:hypothetical protein
MGHAISTISTISRVVISSQLSWHFPTPINKSFFKGMFVCLPFDGIKNKWVWVSSIMVSGFPFGATADGKKKIRSN